MLFIHFKHFTRFYWTWEILIFREIVLGLALAADNLCNSVLSRFSIWLKKSAVPKELSLMMSSWKWKRYPTFENYSEASKTSMWIMWNDGVLNVHTIFYRKLTSHMSSWMSCNWKLRNICSRILRLGQKWLQLKEFPN